MFNDYSDMVSIEELCEMLRIGRNKAYELLRTQQIKAFRCGRLWKIPKQSVIDYVRQFGK